MRRALSLSVPIIGVAFALTTQVSAGGDAAACAAMKSATVPGVNLTITKADWLPAAGPLPAYCRVDGVIDRRTGADGQPFGIGFALALPEEWNGRFLQQGGGGLNGRVAPPMGANAAGDTSGLARRFAVVTTDTGHQGQTFDASFMRDQQAALDFAYVAVGRVALLAKALIARYYGRPADHSYFSGCSTGGREAMLMAERYPSFFDGIVAGSPAMRTNHSNLALRSMVVTFNRLRPRGASGQLTDPAFSDGDRRAVVDGILNACDAADGVKDGMIFNPRGCRFDPGVLVCKGAKADGCLSREQSDAIVKAFAGPKDSQGHQIYPGFLFDTGIGATGQGIPGILAPNAGPPVGAPVTTELDIDRAEREADGDALQILIDTASWTNLGAFSGHGGKLLFYHGMSDPWFSALDTAGYYERVEQDNGGADKVQGWSRLFLVPGMGHCGGGATTTDRFDMLTSVVDWVEKGIAPDTVRATGQSVPGRSRPLCPFPQYAAYKGSGDPQDAVNFTCRK